MQDLLSAALVKRLTIQGFIYSDPALMALEPEFRSTVGGWIRKGEFRWREDIAEGLESAPDAFCRLMRGGNFGKALVRIGPEKL